MCRCGCGLTFEEHRYLNNDSIFRFESEGRTQQPIKKKQKIYKLLFLNISNKNFNNINKQLSWFFQLKSLTRQFLFYKYL